MAIVLWMLVGLAAGWLADRLPQRRHGLLVRLLHVALLIDLGLGLLGALIGGLLARAILRAHGPFSGAWLEKLRVATANLSVTSSSLFGQVVVAALGAAILLALFPLLARRLR